MAAHILVGFVSVVRGLCDTGHAGDLLDDYECNNDRKKCFLECHASLLYVDGVKTVK
jgi:hypothetical protein